MIPYFSSTGTLHNLRVLRETGVWRILISAKGHDGIQGWDHYAIDNGAWWAHQQEQPFDVPAFRSILQAHGEGADWVVVPDMVAAGLESLDFTRSWLPEVLAHTRQALVAVQDGMTPEDVRPLLGPRVGIAVGGTTEFKENSMRVWGRLARELHCYLHVLRVNTRRRIRLCQDAGADSFDGTSVTRFSVTVPLLTDAVSQGHLFGRDDEDCCAAVGGD